MDKINYIIEVFLSCLKDMKSKQKMIKNGWHRHVPVGLVLGAFLAYVTNNSFNNGEALWFQYFVPIFTSFCICWGFERVQGMYANYMGYERPDQLESDKDVVASWVISSIIGVLLYTFLLK